MSHPKGNDQFVAYVGPSNIHDGRIWSLSIQESTVTVEVEGAGGIIVAIEFTGVSKVEKIEPVGMTLYALCEVMTPTQNRKFIFSNWDEGDNRMLEITAEIVRFLR